MNYTQCCNESFLLCSALLYFEPLVLRALSSLVPEGSLQCCLGGGRYSSKDLQIHMCSIYVVNHGCKLQQQPMQPAGLKSIAKHSFLTHSGEKDTDCKHVRNCHIAVSLVTVPRQPLPEK